MLTMPTSSPELRLSDVPWTTANTTIRRGSRLISRKVGLIRRVRLGLFKAQDPALFCLGSEPAEVGRYSAMTPPESSGGGDTLEGSLAAAIGESVERYSMNHYHQDDMALASYGELAETAVHPDLIRLYSRQQIRDHHSKNLTFFDEDTRIRWVQGYSLTHREPRWVPASLVYVYYRPGSDEANIGRNTSTGLGAGGTLEEAILSGLLEVIERDAFIISWLQQRVRRRIIVDEPDLLELLRDRCAFDHPKVDLRFYELTLDVEIPTVMAVLRRPADFGPALLVTAAARLDPRLALRKSLFEIGQLFPFLRYLTHRDWQPAEDFSNIIDFELHSLLYLRRPELVDRALAFCDDAEEAPLSTLTDRSTGRPLGDLDNCVNALRAHGHEVIVVDVTAPEIAELGFRVVRVVVPGLMSLHGDNMRFLGSRRLDELPRQQHWEEQGWDPSAGLNPYPHPFP